MHVPFSVSFACTCLLRGRVDLCAVCVCACMCDGESQCQWKSFDQEIKWSSDPKMRVKELKWGAYVCVSTSLWHVHLLSLNMHNPTWSKMEYEHAEKKTGLNLWTYLSWAYTNIFQFHIFTIEESNENKHKPWSSNFLTSPWPFTDHLRAAVSTWLVVGSVGWYLK